MSQNANPLFASEPWNLVADGYAETTMLVFEQYAEVAIAASKLKPNSTVRAVFRNVESRSVTKSSNWQRPDTDDEEGNGRRAVAREGEACAGLVGRDSAYAEGAADFGCLVGGGSEMRESAILASQNNSKPTRLILDI